jgi:hypothetical protein
MKLALSTVIPYIGIVHTVIETPAYLAAAKDAGMSADELQVVVDLIAANPEAGDIMQGCGGARKLRVARPGSGKSGGYRVISYFAGEKVPVFLLTVFPKNMKSNLTKAEQNAFSKAVKLLTRSLGG